MPVSIPGGGVVDIATADRTSCALTNGGEVWCWGRYSGNGQALGAASRVPTRVTSEDGTPLDADAIFSGPDRLCALSGTTAFCWGSLSAALGANRTASNANFAEPVGLAAGHDPGRHVGARHVRARVEWSGALLGHGHRRQWDPERRRCSSARGPRGGLVGERRSAALGQRDWRLSERSLRAALGRRKHSLLGVARRSVGLRRRSSRPLGGHPACDSHPASVEPHEHQRRRQRVVRRAA
ncbi:MAG: hypothetical protein IPL19_01600 [Sandaracinaceae bacterium]|nr:hypothetical protein [Sandaracinaceae bacterium]